MLSFTISYPDLIKLPYFAGPHSFKEGIGGEKEAQRRQGCYIYFHCSYTYNYYNYMEPCALNAGVSAFHTQI
jgi:hypothetical protein